MNKSVVELFAGVGGFRVGLGDDFKVVYANQFEPSTKEQYAYNCYTTHFGECDNTDITLVDKETIPDHTLLVGGFPCQDYSVAYHNTSKGIEGKKGVLWWQINDILKIKKPPFVLLENVDRLLLSPSNQGGRDFGIILRCFYEQGYNVEWRVINAADYGMPQRRRRTFIFAWHNSTNYNNQLTSIFNERESYSDVLLNGMFVKAFPIKPLEISLFDFTTDIGCYKDLLEVSKNFTCKFENSGIMINGRIYTISTTPIYEKSLTIRDILESNVKKEYFLTSKQRKQFEFLRGSKRILRIREDNTTYYYTEGAMSAYDDLDLPSRTLLTGEGKVDRCSHIIKDPEKNRLRFLTPLECERLDQFPDNWTEMLPKNKRYFCMGNALVCGVIKRISSVLEDIIDKEL